MSDTQQAATDAADTPKTPENEEGTDAQEETLDSLLNEFDENTVEEPLKPEPAPELKAPELVEPVVDSALGDQVDQIRQSVQDLQARETKSDMASAVNTLKTDNESLQKLPDHLVEGLLNAEAQRDPRIQKAWGDRLVNPEGFKKVLDGLGKQISKSFEGAPDPGLTDDRDSVRASVNGQTTVPALDDDKVSNADLCKMSDHELDAHKRSLELGAKR